jgi:hypothetical protein
MCNIMNALKTEIQGDSGGKVSFFVEVILSVIVGGKVLYHDVSYS